MPIETGNYISDLNASNPLAGDPKSQGDDHLRLIKSTLKTTFPNVAGAVTASHTELSQLAGATISAFAKTLLDDSDAATARGTLGVDSILTISNKTGAYTVVANDNGTIINCTANSFTVSLTAAVTLGAGFNCWIWNTSTSNADSITINPDGSETIDGGTTLILYRGEGFQIICDGTNWITGDRKSMRAYSENFAQGARPVVADSSVAIGPPGSANAGAARSSVFGGGSAGTGGVTATGQGSQALGCSYASGTDSFAAAIANNTSSYGATGANSVAMGQTSKASGANSFAAIKGTASGDYSCAIGFGATASGNGSFAFGLATAAQYGRWAFSWITTNYQTGKMLLGKQTTDATPTVLTSDTGAASTANQVILPNDSTYAFTILVVARRTDADNESAGYKFEGVVDRNGSAATTAIVGSVSKTVLAEDTAAWDCNVTADTTNGGLAITVTGEAGKTIRWVATCWTSEVTG